MRRLYQYITLFISILLTALTGILQDKSTRIQEPYHTSALTGEAWVMELLAGHPNRICCELGVSHNVFVELIHELRQLGHGNSKYVLLEEQLAIFLYMSVTGLTISRDCHRYRKTRGFAKTGSAGTGTVVDFGTPWHTAYPYRGIAGISQVYYQLVSINFFALKLIFSHF
jgi:hypothetical protein